MAEGLDGILRFTKKGKRHLEFTTEKGGKMSLNPSPDLLSKKVKDNKDEEISVKVNTGDNGRPTAIYLEDDSAVKEVKEVKANYNIGKTPKSFNKKDSHKQKSSFQTKQKINKDYPKNFHNPYNFVPAPPRDRNDDELGDRSPVGHDHYRKAYFSGKLTIKLKVETPLLLPDTARMLVNEDHKSYRLKLDSEGKPYINPTAVKGMLRSAYETITNSRMGVLNKHTDRLAFRADAKTPISARIERSGDKLIIREFSKTAVLVRYRKHFHNESDKAESTRGLKYPNNQLPQHGDAVWVKIDERLDQNNGRFIGYKVVEIKQRTANQQAPNGYENGWVCITGANTENKVYERVFVENSNDRKIPLEDNHKKMWADLIANYQLLHEQAVKKRKSGGDEVIDYLGDEVGNTAFSRHIYRETDRELEEGTLCYFLENENQVKAIFPVMISRQLYDKSPIELLNESLRPAKKMDELSPADRVFGWVGDGVTKNGAYRGQVRFGSMNCLTDAKDSVHLFGNEDPKTWLPLNNLGQPKPQQGRFYVAESDQGEAQEYKWDNENSGYQEGRGLRGRKVYPHHSNLPDNYWFTDEKVDFAETQNLQAGNRFKEYYRPPGKPQRDSQNRSIQGWVKPKTEFEFDIHFMNLSKVEIGALVWLLDLPEGHFHRFGGGKPFGFGSVRLTLENAELMSGEDMREFYTTLDSSRNQSIQPEECKSAFVNSVNSAYPSSNFLQAFERACKGFDDDKPIQYPRCTDEPYKVINGKEESESFKWFVANSSNDGMKLPLPNLVEDEGLPRRPKHQRQQNNRGRR